MLLLGLLACGPAGAEEVAAVMVVSGDAMIRRDGALLPAEPGLALRTTDTLVTDEDDAIIVHLSNDHVVRIDSELELPVSGIVMLKADESAVEPGEQLASLLYTDERSGIDADLLDRAERVAGWHSRLTAAEAYTGVTTEAGAESEISDISDMEEEAADAPSPPPPPPAPAPAVAAPAKRESAKKDSRPGGTTRDYGGGGGLGLEGAVPDEGSDEPKGRRSRKNRKKPKPGKTRDASNSNEVPADSPGRSIATVGGEAPAPDASITPAALAERFADGGDLRTCVVDWADGLPVSIASIDVTVIVDADGRIERLAAGGGLFLPECARSAAEDALLEGSDTSPVRFSVELD